MSGPPRGGCSFSRGNLYHMLSNRIYLGDIVHKGEAFPGEHEAIVPQELWDQVQAKAAERANGGARRRRARNPSLLIGLIEDGLGRRMTPTHTARASRAYRYYVTRPDQIAEQPAWRVSAHDVENLVCSQLHAFMTNQRRLMTMLDPNAVTAVTTDKAIGIAEETGATLLNGSAHNKEVLIRRLVSAVRMEEQRILIELKTADLLSLLALPSIEIDPITIATEAVRVRRGHQIRLIIPGAQPIITPERKRDTKLVALIGEALTARELVMASPDKSMLRIAADAGRCRTRLQKLVGISCLAPDIVTSIVEGSQPPTLTAKNLLATNLPLDWKEQRKLFGIAQ